MGILASICVLACAWSRDRADLGNTAFQEGRFDEAIGHYRQALEAGPDFAVQVNLGHCYMRLERWSEAGASYQAAIESGQGSATPDLWQLLGQARYQSGQFEQALDAFLQAGALGVSDNAQNNMWTARCLIELEQWVQARSVLYEHVRRHPRGTEGLELLAYVLGHMDDWSGVVSTYTQLLAKSPDRTAYRIALANALAVTGRNLQAIDALEFAWRADRSATAQVNRLLADLYLAEAMPHEAAVCYARLIRRSDRPTADDYLRLGMAYFQGGELTSADEAFRRMQRADPNSAEASLYLGHVATVQERLDEARTHYETALAKAPASTESLLALGQLQMKSERYANAAACFARALELGDNRPEVHYNHVLALLRQIDRQQQAKEAIKAALAQHPADSRLAALLDRFVSQAAAQPPDR